MVVFLATKVMDSEEKKPSKKAVIISSVFLGIILLYGGYVGISRRVALSGKVRYTIGITGGIQLSAAGRDIKYHYTVNGRTYTDVTTYAFNSQKEGGRYFVKFSVEHPEHSELYQNKPIPDHIIEVPREGWSKIPSR